GTCEQRLVDVVVDRSLAAVVDEVWVETRRLRTERDRDLGAVDRRRIGARRSGVVGATAGRLRRRRAGVAAGGRIVGVAGVVVIVAATGSENEAGRDQGAEQAVRCTQGLPLCDDALWQPREQVASGLPMASVDGGRIHYTMYRKAPVNG